MKLKLGKIKKDPRDEGREWQWVMSLKRMESKRTNFSLAVDLYITKFNNEEVFRMVQTQGIVLLLNPKDWRLNTYHQWYDGPNCVWNFGPISIFRSGVAYCKKCEIKYD